jgi:hypothetical protein
MGQEHLRSGHGPDLIRPKPARGGRQQGYSALDGGYDGHVNRWQSAGGQPTVGRNTMGLGDKIKHGAEKLGGKGKDAAGEASG